MRIYIAGPYTADTAEDIVRNVNAAMDAGLRLARRGHHPFIPHLTHFLEMRGIETGEGLSYEWYLAYDHFWLTCCDALLLLAHSPGADKELQWAKNRGLLIFYSENEIPDGGITC